jgi:hypothetical protein
MPLMTCDDKREGGKLCDDVIMTILGNFYYVLNCEVAIIILNSQIISGEFDSGLLTECIQPC